MTKHILKIITLAIIFALLGKATLVVRKILGVSSIQSYHAFQQSAQNRHVECKRDAIGRCKVDVLLLGDSILDFWQTDGKVSYTQLTSNKNWLNYATAGDRITNLRWRISDGLLANIQPRYVLISIGINDITNNVPFDAVVQAYRKLIFDLGSHPGLKRAKFILIPPFNPDKNNVLTSFAEQIEQIGKDTNMLVVNSRALTEQKLRNQFLIDGVHLSSSGYDQLSVVLQSMIEYDLE